MAPTPRLDLAAVEMARRTPGRSVLLFITDRCPVGCAHCSVDSRSRGPTISDHARFAAIVDGICALPGLQVVGISGGEPFVERRGLTFAAGRIRGAGKRLVVYTSGAWAGAPVPSWIHEILSASDCVFLSTDAFHADRIPDRVLARAAAAIAGAGSRIVVQVLDLPDTAERAERLLAAALGPGWAELAELNRIAPLPYGRGAALFARTGTRPASSFRGCRLLAAPVIRYDGAISACCNERVLMGAGPARLRRRSSGADVVSALASLRSDPLLAAIATVGPGPLMAAPEFADLASMPCGSICDACWALAGRASEAGPVPLLEALEAARR